MFCNSGNIPLFIIETSDDNVWMKFTLNHGVYDLVNMDVKIRGELHLLWQEDFDDVRDDYGLCQSIVSVWWTGYTKLHITIWYQFLESFWTFVLNSVSHVA